MNNTKNPEHKEEVSVVERAEAENCVGSSQ